MERKIIFPKCEKEEILYNQVEDELISRGGMILVYDREGNTIGHVVLVDYTWVFKTANISAEADLLEELMVDYSNYTFKLVN